jgi:hypothetical protein
LDKPRRAALSATIQDASQAIISTTDLDDFSAELLARARLLRVNEGRIEEPEPMANPKELPIEQPPSIVEESEFAVEALSPEELGEIISPEGEIISPE